MDAQAVIVVSGSVVALTQLVKWSGMPDKYGPIAVLVLALAGTAFWGWSQGNFTRESSFLYFAGWISVATSAAGIFGFTRASRDAVAGTSRGSGSSGAGNSTTV